MKYFGRRDLPEMVTIIDPIAHVQYTLDRVNHVAHAVSFPISESAPPSPPPRSPSPSAPNISDDVDQYLSQRRAPYKMTSEDLGTQTIEGILVKGERTTWALPAGAGGGRPMVKVQEVWISTDLEITILSRYSDSSGETVTTSMTSLDRSEPDPELFQVPPDYTVQEAHTK